MTLTVSSVIRGPASQCVVGKVIAAAKLGYCWELVVFLAHAFLGLTIILGPETVACRSIVRMLDRLDVILAGPGCSGIIGPFPHCLLGAAS